MSLTFAGTTSAQGVDAPPDWAYPVNPPGFRVAPDDGSLRRVPDSTLALTLSQVRDLYVAPDWHPGDHPPMPQVVSQGRRPEVYACGFCHRADGPGGPENASLAGLPADYILQQMADFASGARRGSVPSRLPMELMIAVSRAVTAAESAAAAAYFSALRPRSIIEVVETDTVPRTQVAGWHFAVVPGDEREPIEGRIIEVPQDLEQFVSRDARARFIAFVPIGSVRMGQALVAGGGGSGRGGAAVACGSCHGADLKGLGSVPGIAGRSPSYIVRQLYDFKHGARAGGGGVLMRPIVEKLRIDDMVAIAAYLASLPP